MTLQERLPSMRTLIVLMALPSALGYVASAPPTTKPAFVLAPTRQAPSDCSSRVQKYHLGLGKNAPLTTNEQTRIYETLNVQKASQFWMVNEPAVTFPSPQSPKDEEHEQVPRKRKQAIPLIPKRQSEDVLQISSDRVMSRTRSDRLDLNTPWVEMLIHSQQMQLAHSHCQVDTRSNTFSVTRNDEIVPLNMYLP